MKMPFDAKGQRRMARLLGADRKARITHPFVSAKVGRSVAMNTQHISFN